MLLHIHLSIQLIHTPLCLQIAHNGRCDISGQYGFHTVPVLCQEHETAECPATFLTNWNIHLQSPLLCDGPITSTAKTSTGQQVTITSDTKSGGTGGESAANLGDATTMGVEVHVDPANGYKIYGIAQVSTVLNLSRACSQRVLNKTVCDPPPPSPHLLRWPIFNLMRQHSCMPRTPICPVLHTLIVCCLPCLLRQHRCTA